MNHCLDRPRARPLLVGPDSAHTSEVWASLRALHGKNDAWRGLAWATIPRSDELNQLSRVPLTEGGEGPQGLAEEWLAWPPPPQRRLAKGGAGLHRPLGCSPVA